MGQILTKRDSDEEETTKSNNDIPPLESATPTPTASSIEEQEQSTPPPPSEDTAEESLPPPPPSPPMPDLPVSINAGGQSYVTTTGTLVAREPRSWLARMLESGENRTRIEQGQEMFIDRDGHLFGHVLNYLRNGDHWVLPESDETRGALLTEAEFFRLDALAQMIRAAQNVKMAVSTLRMKSTAQVKILFLGDCGVGKTSILAQFCDKTFNSNQAATIGVDYRVRNVQVEGQIIKFYFWDTTGQERFRSMTRSYYRGSKGVIFVFDVTNRESFDQLQHWIKDFESNVNPDGTHRFPKILVANKIDLDETRAVTKIEGREFADKNGLTYMEASAKTSQGVDSIFEEMKKQILHQPDLLEGLGDREGRRVRGGQDPAKKWYLCCQ